MRKYLSIVVVLALAYFVIEEAGFIGRVGDEPTAAGSRLAEAFQNRSSDFLVQGAGVVARILPDDNDGSRHQRFILRLESGQTLLVAHNIDLAPRITELEEGDTVEFFGEYEWNEQGGVIHWTHLDPRGQHEAGWLRHEGRIYQ